MNSLQSIILAATLVTALIIPANVLAIETPELPTSQEFQITGAGATFPFPLIDLWRVEYNSQFSNVNLNYQSIGSGGGIKQHIERTVNFAASDKPMKGAEAEKAEGTLHIPETIGGVVIAYNVPEIPDKGLKLTGEIIAEIFLEKITKWNDPKIVELNPELNLPDETIISAHRSDGSGTTFVFTDYLVTVSPEWDEKIGKGKSIPWPSGVGAAGNEGVAGIVKTTDYSIGYIELAYAFQTGLPYAFVQNGDGTAFIEPSLDSISKASAGLANAGLPASQEDWSEVSMVNAPGPDSYPIATFTYLLVYENIEKVTDSMEEAKAVVHMIHWMITEGQKHSATLLYVPLSSSVVELGKEGLSRITFNGDQVWDYSPSGIMESSNEMEIPNWIKNNAAWWYDGTIDDATFVSGIQFLISEGIMTIPETQSGTATSQGIPPWVKNNAGWWADDLIGDSDFISGIQFLVTEGIIQV